MSLEVHEIFYGMQGEGADAGYPCTFVRLSRCNLRCGYCDTPEAREPGKPLTIDAIVAQVASLGCRLVAVTGGEPLFQPDTPALLDRLVGDGCRVLLETNGSLPVNKVPDGVVTILDLKCPGSGADVRVCWENLDRLRPGDEVKFVVRSRADFDWAVKMVEVHGLERYRVWISPAWGEVEPREAVEWILASRKRIALLLQWHKLLGGDKERKWLPPGPSSS